MNRIVKKNSFYKYFRTVLLCFACLCCPVSIWAGDGDFGVWAGVGVEKKIAKGFSAELEGEFRTTDGLSAVDRLGIGFDLSYKITSWLSASAGYTFLDNCVQERTTSKGNIVSEYWQVRHRSQVSLTGKVNAGRFKFSLRERWQYTYRPDQSVQKYASDGVTAKSDEYVKGKGKNVLRSRLQVAYDIKNCKFTPYLSCELFTSLHGDGTEKTRYTIGGDWKLSKRHYLDFYYLYQNRSDEDESSGHVIGVAYKFKF